MAAAGTAAWGHRMPSSAGRPYRLWAETDLARASRRSQHRAQASARALVPSRLTLACTVTGCVRPACCFPILPMFLVSCGAWAWGPLQLGAAQGTSLRQGAGALPPDLGLRRTGRTSCVSLACLFFCFAPCLGVVWGLRRGAWQLGAAQGADAFPPDHCLRRTGCVSPACEGRPLL